MTDHCDSCPFAGCPTCGYAGGEIPAAATESDTRTGVGQGMIRGLAHTRETPASIGVDRGRGPTVEESNVKHRTPEPPPVAVL